MVTNKGFCTLERACLVLAPSFEKTQHGWRHFEGASICSTDLDPNAWALLRDSGVRFLILGRITTLVLWRKSPLNLHWFCLTRDSKYWLVGTDQNAICQYFTLIPLYLAFLFIMSNSKSVAEIAKVMQNMLELRGTSLRFGEPAIQNYWTVGRTCKMSRMIIIITFDCLCAWYKKKVFKEFSRVFLICL